MLWWLTVRSRWLYFLALATFNILHDSSPIYLRDLFSHSAPSAPPSSHLTPDVFAIPNFRTSTSRNSFYSAAIYFWHSLPDPVGSLLAVAILKGRLRAFIWPRYVHTWSGSQCWSGSPRAYLSRWVVLFARVHGKKFKQLLHQHVILFALNRRQQRPVCIGRQLCYVGNVTIPVWGERVTTFL